MKWVNSITLEQRENRRDRQEEKKMKGDRERRERESEFEALSKMCGFSLRMLRVCGNTDEEWIYKRVLAKI